MDSALMVCVKCQRRLGSIIRRSFSIHNHSLQQRNYYDVLGVKRSAPPSEIKAAYIDLSKKLHPDTNLNQQHRRDPDHRHNSFVELNEAYAVLSKSLSRHQYDIRLSNRPGTQTAGVQVRRARAAHATPDDPYGAQQGENDWYRDLGSVHPNAGSWDGNYYGIKGIPRVRSVYILYGCIFFLVVGAVVRFFIFKQSSDYVISRLDEKDRRIATIYNEAKARAMQNGNKKQIELLRARQKEFNLKHQHDQR